ncbi:O-antigen ligase family protein [Dietzia massiliensis]|uniref:O-antigen ligase family protein n=1 Tax=Dietzia massiliensis TaxID=2697499 RepID=UPI001BCE4680|nr:O-antigen ligase family protein [Dietzia massiliensis]MBS7549478.1 O-antigen ligase family protein [Dietzia massiliensis]
MLALFAAASMTLLAFGGYAAGTLTQLGFPVSPILLGAAGTAVSAAVVVVTRPWTLRGILMPIALWLTMIAGFIYSAGGTTYSDGKVSQLLTMTPLVVGAGAILLALPEVRSKLLFCVTVWGGFIALLQYVTPSTESILTLSAEGSNYQNYGRAVGAAAVALIVLGFRRRTSSIPFLIVGVGFLTLTALSGSRGPFIGAVIAIIIGLAVTRASAITALAGAAVTLLVFQFFDPAKYLPDRFRSFEDNSTQARVWMLEIAWERFRDWPFGIGWGGLEMWLNPIGTNLLYPHNVYAEVAVEAGILGLVGFAGYTIYALVGQYKTSTTGVEAAILALSVFMVSNAAVSGDINSNRGLHLFLAAGIAAWTIHRVRTRDDGPGPTSRGRDPRIVDTGVYVRRPDRG